MTSPNRQTYTFAARDDLSPALAKMKGVSEAAEKAFDKLGDEAKRAGTKMTLTEKASAGLSRELGEQKRKVLELSVAYVLLGDSASKAQRQELAAARSRQSELARALKLMAPGAPSRSRGLPDVEPRTALIGAAVAGGALAAGPAGIAAVVAGTGAAALAVGIASAATDQKVVRAFTELGTRLKPTWLLLGQQFVDPLAAAADRIGDAVERIAARAMPVMSRLSGMVSPLVDGLIGLVERAMPGILEAVDASAPLLATLAQHLPRLGESLGRAFEIMSDPKTVEATQRFLDLVLTLVEVALPALASALAFSAGSFDGLRQIAEISLRGTVMIFTGGLQLILEAAVRAFGWIDGIGPRLKEAQRQFAEFVAGLDAKLDAIDGRRVTATVQVDVRGISNSSEAMALILGRRQHGGPAHRGVPVLVGERQPEVFVPESNGWIHPDARKFAGAGGPLAVEVTLNLKYPDGSVIVEKVQAHATRSGKRTLSGTFAMPA